MASTYIQRINGTPDNRKKFTFSVWVKRAKLGTYQYIHGFQDNGVSDPRMTINFRDDDSFEYSEVNSTGTELGRLRPSMKFRDTSGWYAITVAVDTTLATADDRIKIWVNGEQQTSISVRVNYTQNFDTCIDDNRHTIGAIYNTALSGYFDGSLSHYHYCDGYAYQASDFGETDSTTGEWKIKTSPSVSYGTNGCFVLKDTNSGTDQSGNSNNLTISGGTLTKTEDCPSNVFATFNPLASWRGQNNTPQAVLANGNLKTGIGTSEMTLLTSTIGVKSGKWYWEAKSDGVSKMFFGICNSRAFGETGAPHDHTDQATSTGIYYYEAIPDFRYNTTSTSTTGAVSISSGDILGFAMDCDNSVFWIHKNGVYMNSGVPTSGDTGTGAINRMFNYAGSLFYDSGVKTEMFASCYVSSSSGSGTASYNFGNGYFGTTAVSTPGTNASGIGIFEYDVPTGYTALSTKGLNL